MSGTSGVRRGARNNAQASGNAGGTGGGQFASLAESNQAQRQPARATPAPLAQRPPQATGNLANTPRQPRPLRPAGVYVPPPLRPRQAAGSNKEIREIKTSESKTSIQSLDKRTLLEIWKEQQSQIRSQLSSQMMSHQAASPNDAEIGDDTRINSIIFSDSKMPDNLSLEKWEHFVVPGHIASFGSNFNAPRLKIISFQTSGIHSYKDFEGKEQVGGSSFKYFGSNFNAPSLQEIDLRNQKSFNAFGENFNAPNLTLLKLEGCTAFKNFPHSIKFPSLVTLDLSGAKEFKRFPENFFDGMVNLRHISIMGSGVRFREIPAHVRNNPNIHIDIQPPGGIAGRRNQTTHQRSVHASASNSATRLLSNFPNLDRDAELKELSDYVMNIAGDDVPDGLDLYKTTDDILNNLKYLPEDHPHREYFKSPINAARRAVADGIPWKEFVDPTSKISVGQFVAAAWLACKDEKYRKPEVLMKTAQDGFIAGLYETKREYNISEDHIDDGDPRDKTGCGGGAFNKWQEILTLFLSDVQQIYIDMDSIRHKMKPLVEEAISLAINNGSASLKDFTKPDAEGEIFCSPQLANRLEGDIFNKLIEDFSIPVAEQERVKQFLDYQFIATDFSFLLKGASKSQSTGL